jgi:hypothetical protein
LWQQPAGVGTHGGGSCAGDDTDLAEAFGAVTPTPPSEWPDDRFDVVWTFTRTADGWQFAQLPELLLPQDEVGVIQDRPTAAAAEKCMGATPEWSRTPTLFR